MRFFRRAPRSRFRADMLQWLDAFGRYQLDPQRSNVPPESGMNPWDWFGWLWEMMKEDPDGFFTDLRTIVAEDRGGFATYGAACVARELLSGEGREPPAALALIDAGIEFKLARGLGSFSLTAYENRRLMETRRQSEQDR
ncbi:hypothetical protein Cs7R123_62820 [Catellatospora sp. TT07R-123]|uniref:hypothetical protein n=1 Tax=Catellatospora sp. TT07R-123 TaxID=2733863 RepID=UPI001B09C1B3|nr:hypothetical protein [Catellatospora sp. TT07R-123]GHJ48940.1 hypothetical protein Cs7R123_62820 [Catellatospora sp. TT07R-123]